MIPRRGALMGLLLLVFAAGLSTGRSVSSAVHAQEPIKATIPSSWGHCVASVPGGMVFEDSQGVVRLADMQGRLQAQYDRN
jgi:hypothetical protein